MGHRTAYALIVGAGVLWGLSGVLTKSILAGGVDAFDVAFWRMAFGGALFGMHAARRGELRLESRADGWALAAFGVFAIALHYVAFNLATQYGGVSIVFLFLASVPALVAVGSRLFLGERLTFRTGCLVSLSALGLVLVSRGNGPGVVVTVASVSLSLIVAMTVVAYTVAGKGLLRRYSPVGVNAFVMPVGAVALLPFAGFDLPPASTWLLLGVLVVGPTYLAHLLYQTGLRTVDATRAALLVNVEALTALVTAALFLGERFTTLGTAGIGLILIVSLMTVLPEPSRPRSGERQSSVSSKNIRSERSGDPRRSSRLGAGRARLGTAG